MTSLLRPAIVIFLLLLASIHAEEQKADPIETLVGRVMQDQKSVESLFKDYSLQGVIGDKLTSSWPAQVVRVVDGLGGVKFDVKGYGPQFYPPPDYHGKKFRVVILSTENAKEVAVILIK